MNRRAFLKSLSASALLAKLCPALFKAKPAPLVIKTGGIVAFTIDSRQTGFIAPNGSVPPPVYDFNHDGFWRPNASTITFSAGTTNADGIKS